MHGKLMKNVIPAFIYPTVKEKILEIVSGLVRGLSGSKHLKNPKWKEEPAPKSPPLMSTQVS